MLIILINWGEIVSKQICFKLLIKVLICENQVFPKYRQRNQSGMHRIDEYAWHFGLAGKPTARTLNVPDNHNYYFLLYLCHHRYCEISQARPSNHINKYYYHIKMQGKNWPEGHKHDNYRNALHFDGLISSFQHHLLILAINFTLSSVKKSYLIINNIII